MSDLLTTYVTFSAIDFKGENMLSSFALESTPLLFVPDLANNYGNVLWSFGDGTTSTSLCASKSYTYPGQYIVNLVVYDCYGNANISAYSQTVTIYDYFPFTFALSASNYNGFTLKTGEIAGPFKLIATYPPYQPQSNVFWSVSGSNSVNFWNISANKFAHLEKYHSFFVKNSNATLSTFQFEETYGIPLDFSNIYAKISGNSIAICPPSDSGSFFVGVSGTKDVYFKDDNVSSLLKIKLFFDKTNNYNYLDGYNRVNTLGVTLTAAVLKNEDINRLAITSTGLDGERYVIESFQISPIKYENVVIPFIITIKDDDEHTVKSFQALELSSFSFSVLSSDYLLSESGEYLTTEDGDYIVADSSPISPSYYSISSVNYTLSGQTHPGSFRGTIKFSGLPISKVDGMIINASGSFISDSLTAYSLSGSSSYFDVYRDKHYQIYKINENFDAEQTLKDLRFQPTLIDKNILFEDFFGTIFGNLTSDYNAVGKKTYEKIANFVANNSDVDVNEITALISQLQFLDNNSNIYDSSLFSYPEEIKRLINLASISKNKLMGYQNKFNENFDTKGHVQKDYYGRNLGSHIDTTSYVITAGTPIVALEKFSGEYQLLNTYQPLCASQPSTYMLSAYSSSWGWPLVLPVPFTPSEFDKYYIFFEYVVDDDNTIIGSSIDFNNTMTTVLSTSTNYELFNDNGIFETMFINTLYDSLSLFS